MADPKHLAKLKEGADKWNEWRFERYRTKTDLGGVDLSEANFSTADLSGVTLPGEPQRSDSPQSKSKRRSYSKDNSWRC